MANNRSILERLPSEIATELGSHLDKRALACVSRASKTTHALFAPVSDVAKLLDFVQEANYDQAKKMVATDPTLMFKYVFNKNESISPLKLAVKQLDTHMWKMFLERIIGYEHLRIETSFPTELEIYKNTCFLLSKQFYAVNADGKAELAKVQHPGLFNCFLKQVEEQQALLNLKDVFASYKKFLHKFAKWRGMLITGEEMANAWLNVGKQQHDVLPRHMLKELCFSNSWDGLESSFNAFSNTNNSIVIGLPLLSGLGRDFALKRGYNWRPAERIEKKSCKNEVFQNLHVENDSLIFACLYQVRSKELSLLKSQLELSPQNTLRMNLS